MGGPAPLAAYVCEICKAHFQSRKRYDRVVRYCSRQCTGKAKIGIPNWNKGGKAPWAIHNQFAAGHKPWNKDLKGDPRLLIGAKNPKWKGGRYITVQGYIFVSKSGHPRANTHGYVPEQILVAEECLGRPLLPDEIVHHINFCKTDNRPENLFVFENGREHTRHHGFLRSGKEQPKVSNLLGLSHPDGRARTDFEFV